MSRRITGDRSDEIGRDFNLKRYSFVSTVIERMKAQISRDRKLGQRVEKLKTLLTHASAYSVKNVYGWTLGKYVTPNVFVIYRHSLKTGEGPELDITYEINRNLGIEAQAGNEKTSGVDLMWEHEF